MSSHVLAAIAVAAGLAVASLPAAQAAQPHRPAARIGTGVQLFVDDALIDMMSGAELRLHPPTPADVALQFNSPWEGPASTYVTVFRDGDRYRMYYSGYDEVHDPVTCYAESLDGVHWVKPQLGLFAFQGSAKNNIVWALDDRTTDALPPVRYGGPHGPRPSIKSYRGDPGSAKTSTTENFAPFLDTNPQARRDELYKALAGAPPMALGSPDGLHWHYLSDLPVMAGESYDSLNTALWDPRLRRYVAYVRANDIPGHAVRSIVRRTSADFLHWGSGSLIDDGGAPLEQLYTNGVTPYFRAPDVSIALPMRFVEGRTVVSSRPEDGVSDAVFMSSRDGIHFSRRFLDAFIRPGSDADNWTARSVMPAWGVVPTGSGEMSVYYTEHYRLPSDRLRRGTIRTDGFVSVHAPYAGGQLVTRPLTFSGTKLVINAATSAAGSVRVDILDASGRPIPGFLRVSSVAFYGDLVDHVVSWAGPFRLEALNGRPVRLRFVLRDADLYSFRFAP